MMVKPFFSNLEITSPIKFLLTPSGLTTTNVRSKQIYRFVFAAVFAAIFCPLTCVLGSCLAHFSFLASRLSTVAFFLHFEEQYQKVAASFLMYIIPVPRDKVLLQNEHRFGVYDKSTNHISRENPSPISSLEQLHTHLGYFSRNSCSPHDLNNLRRSYSLFGSCAHSTPQLLRRKFPRLTGNLQLRNRRHDLVYKCLSVSRFYDAR